MPYWDGVTLNPELVGGGTARIVRHRPAGLPAEYASALSPLDAIDAGPVVQIVTPREKNPRPALKPFSRHPLGPGGWGTASDAMGDVKL